ncbi:UvrD-helicase domain-containing protein [Alistipes sp.]|uniref:UvrD-helicase domain-containing protein n=1 Tax=Alistipes sp. TaxID=1872444 RepID=UPI0025BC5D66|nr:UvrD-helicase domain-containing protein [Alistipes sp.]MCI7140602.1 UvrD-helicase domain-containing protein [Alistipes sp.]
MRAKILNASAGSGKTYQLAYKYVRDVIGRPDLYRHILAVTFTNKATEEMKSRILKEIHALASGAQSNYLEDLCRETGLDAPGVRKRAAEVRAKILHDYSHFTVLTIDTFFQRILRAFIKELGLDLNYNVEIETASVLSKSADTLIDRIADDPALERWFSGFVQERIDDGRKWDVRDGILALGGELFKERNKEVLAHARPKEELGAIVARATSRALASRERMRRVAAEAVGIIDRAGLTAADFSGKSRSFANYFYSVARGETKAPTETARKRAADSAGWAAKGSPAERLVETLRPKLQELCDLYDANLRSWNTCELLRENYRSFALLSDLYAQVQQLCAEQNTMLLPETKHLLAEFIGRNDAPFIYEKVGNRYERFMIDEFQDTSVREWENFLPLLQNAMAQSEETSVLLVGDIKQSIYRWRGGDWRLLHEEAQQALGTENTRVEALRENWRSLPTIVAFNNEAIDRIVEEDNRMLNAEVATAAERGDLRPDEAGTLHDTLANAYRGHKQQPRRREEQTGYVSIETFAERPPVVERVCELIDRGFRPADIMILVRSAADGAKVAAELLAFKSRNEDSRYRFDVMTQEALIVGKSPVSSFLVAALHLALDTADALNRAVFNRYLGRAFDQPLSEDECGFFRSIRLLSPEEAFERIVMHYELQNDRNGIAYMQALHEQIIAFSAAKIADIALFLRWWNEQGQNRSLSVEQSASTVEITTIHKAKGLEKRAVIIPYCSWPLDPKSGGNIQNIVWAEARDDDAAEIGRFPVRYKKTMAESGFAAEYYRELVYAHVDNVNLLYVALTRAAESLHLFIPQKNGRTVGSMLLQSLRVENDRVRVGALEGSYTSDEAGEHYRFGAFTGPVADKKGKSEAQHTVLESYPTAEAKLRLRLPGQRYFEEGGDRELAPRNFGILMHRAFEQATDAEDIRKAVAAMQADGILTSEDAARLGKRIDRALELPEVNEWFGGRWEKVLNEQEIVLPHSGSTEAGNGTIRRPDRVMIDGTRAVVVDYKFGGHDAERYRRQIASYSTLLREMGYARVEGYLWYVSQGRVERVI